MSEFLKLPFFVAYACAWKWNMERSCFSPKTLHPFVVASTCFDCHSMLKSSQIRMFKSSQFVKFGWLCNVSSHPSETTPLLSHNKGQLRVQCPSLFDTVAQHLITHQNILEQCTSQGIANIVWAYATAGSLAGPPVVLHLILFIVPFFCKHIPSHPLV